ncbi:unnamed protein product [Soboliphyme baturini]|uniref:39S ribosomal protein L36, mitochondrial n=1 Tax=Soboliphyme baturini TaxID=241478 RepID=A0A183ITR1_9BILA|nr:unnamed protein product [Soboliphyme baturini]
MPAKSKWVLVMLESIITGHRQFWIRERTAEKVEKILVDPQIRRRVLFREVKRIRAKSQVENFARNRFGLE